jgi:hypothetical protein
MTTNLVKWADDDLRLLKCFILMTFVA